MWGMGLLHIQPRGEQVKELENVCLAVLLVTFFGMVK